MVRGGRRRPGGEFGPPASERHRLERAVPLRQISAGPSGRSSITFIRKLFVADFVQTIFVKKTGGHSAEVKELIEAVTMLYNC